LVLTRGSPAKSGAVRIKSRIRVRVICKYTIGSKVYIIICVSIKRHIR
jgi:hypothetical protein